MVVFDGVVVDEDIKGVVATVYRVREEMAAEEATVTDRLGCLLQMQCPKNKLLFCAEPNNAQRDRESILCRGGVIERDSKLSTHLSQNSANRYG